MTDKQVSRHIGNKKYPNPSPPIIHTRIHVAGLLHKPLLPKDVVVAGYKRGHCVIRLGPLTDLPEW